MKAEDNEVYFLGDFPRKPKRKRRVWLVAVVALLALLALLAVIKVYYGLDDVKEPQGEMLQTVSVHPDGIRKMPRFDGDKEMTDFYRWLAENLKYPKGLEQTEARVIVHFVVRTDGTLGDFKIIDAPENKAFEQTVIELLKRSPRWAPAELENGTKVAMDFTLPVSFKPTK